MTVYMTSLHDATYEDYLKMGLEGKIEGLDRRGIFKVLELRKSFKDWDICIWYKGGEEWLRVSKDSKALYIHPCQNTYSVGDSPREYYHYNDLDLLHRRITQYE